MVSPGHKGNLTPGLRLGILLSAELTQASETQGCGLSNYLNPVSILPRGVSLQEYDRLMLPQGSRIIIPR